MPLHLLHGFASPQKLKVFLDHLVEAICKDQSPLVLCDNARQVRFLRTQLLQQHQLPALPGQMFQTWREYFLKIIKQKNHGGHLLDDDLGFAVMALATHRSKQFEQFKNPVSEITHLQKLWIHLKRQAITLEHDFFKIQKRFKSELTPQTLKIYQSLTRDLNHFDEGDILFESLLLSRSKNIFEHNQTIFFWGVHPLPRSLRFLIREVLNPDPALNIVLVLDIDHQDQDNVLQLALEDMGELSNRSEHIATSVQKIIFNEYSDSSEALCGVVKTLNSALQTGIPANRFAISCSSANGQILFPTLVSQGLSPVLDHSVVRHQNVLIPEPVHEVFKSRPSPSLDQEWRLSKAFESQKESRDFCFSILQHQNLLDSEARFLHDCFDARGQSIALPGISHSFGLKLTSFKNARYEIDRTVFAINPFSESSGSNSASYFLNIENLSREDHERYGSDTYTAALYKSQMKNLATALPSLVIVTDQKTRSQFASPFEDVQIVTIHAQQSGIQNLSHSFIQNEKIQFGITAIEDYIQCPYKYYAARQLKLGDWQDDQLGVEAIETGTALHSLLEHLVSDDLELYKHAIQNFPEASQKIDVKISKLLEDLQNSQVAQHIPVSVRNAWIQNLGDAAHALLKLEREWHKKSQKITVPTHCEFKLEHKILVDDKTITITGKIDRIDVDPSSQTFSVIDYKSGTKTTGPKPAKEGKWIQVPFYMHVLENTVYKNYQPSAALLLPFGDLNKASGFVIKNSCDQNLKPKSKITHEDWENISNLVLQKITQAVHGILNDDFAPHPEDTQNCSYCSYRNLCGYDWRNRNDTSDTD